MLVDYSTNKKEKNKNKRNTDTGRGYHTRQLDVIDKKNNLLYLTKKNETIICSIPEQKKRIICILLEQVHVQTKENKKK
jgi:hypothetical protein